MIDLTTFAQVFYLLCGLGAMLAVFHERQDVDDSLLTCLLVYVLVLAVWPVLATYCVVASALAGD